MSSPIEANYSPKISETRTKPVQGMFSTFKIK